jgi:hypothetical protein
MSNVKLVSKTLATAAAFAFAAATATTVMANEMAGKNFNCEGGNKCKGHSEGKNANNACKGQNKCKGQGVVMTTDKAECDKKKEEVKNMPAPAAQ